MIRHCYYDKTDNTIHNEVVEEDYDDIGLRYHLILRVHKTSSFKERMEA